MVTGVRPDLSPLHAIGSRGFVLNKHLPRGDKLEDRTFEGFLLGYDASNIYRIWLPATNRVIRVRDVRFVDELYEKRPTTQHVESQIVETVHIPEEEYDGDTIIVAQPIRQRQEAVTTRVSPPAHVAEDEYDGDAIAVYQKPVRQLLSPSPTPTFEGQDRSPSPNLVKQQLLQESSALVDLSLHRTPRGWNDYEDADTIRVDVPTRGLNAY